MKQLSDLEEVLNETIIDVAKPDKTIEFLEVARYRPLSDCFHFLRVYVHFSISNDESEVLHLRLFKFALFWV